MMWWRWSEEHNCWQPTLVPPRASFAVNDHATLVPVNDGRLWALLSAETAATINGRPSLPIEILDDRDEVRLADEQFCFSTQSPAEVVTFGGAMHDKKPTRCARCLSDLADRDRIIRCPRCRTYYHEACWPYDTCRKCGNSTTAALWTPDPLN